MITLGLLNLLYTASVLFSAWAFATIPRLYTLFEYLSTFRFLSAGFIKNVWNNIYIFVSVIVLFAIAIKLITTIVNPDSFSDSKKGVKAYYFRTVIAVILIFIVPIIFDYSYNIQEELLKNNFLWSHVLGYEVDSSQVSIGVTLASETYKSFCTPIDESKLTDAEKARYENLGKDSDSIGEFSSTATFYDPAMASPSDATNAKYKYNAILCPIALFLVLYELFLLCMDTAFRAAKLAFLQMMLPIILGGFVFNPEILKKWAKEFFTTYITLFLKVIGLGITVVSFAAIRNMVKTDVILNKDTTMQGLFGLLYLIAVLQLVKKIPDLINTIFGVQIKAGGGIKGRLGEMAGVGGLAQKAWTSLGNGAKNLAKMGLKAPYAGAAALGNYIYKEKTGKNLTDTKAVRGMRAAGAGLASAWKNGSWMKAVEAGTAAYDKTSASTPDKLRMAQRVNNDLNSINTYKDGAGNDHNVTNETDMVKKNEAKAAYDQRVKSYGGSTVSKANDEYQKKTEAANHASTMHKNMTAIIDAMNDRANQLEQQNDVTGAEKIRQAVKDYDAHGDETKIGAFFLNNQPLFDPQVIENMIGENGKVTAIRRQKEYLANNWQNWGLTKADYDNFNRGNAALGFLATNTLKAKADSAKTDLDIAIAGAKLSELDKQALDNYIAAETALTNSYAFAVGRSAAESNSGLTSTPIQGPVPGPAPAPTSAPAPTPAPETVVERVERVVGVSETPTTAEHNERYQDLLNAFSTSGIVEPTGNTGAVPTSGQGTTIINNINNNNNSNTNNNSEAPSKKKDETVKVDTSGIEEAINKMGGNVSEAVTNEGKAIREEINSQGIANKNSTDKVKDVLDDIDSKIPPKNKE